MVRDRNFYPDMVFNLSFKVFFVNIFIYINFKLIILTKKN